MEDEQDLAVYLSKMSTSELALYVLDTVKQYSEQAVAYGYLNPSTKIRLGAAIDYLTVAYETVNEYGEVSQTLFPYKDTELNISLLDLCKIKDMAKPVNVHNDIILDTGIDIARAMLSKFVKGIVSRESKEVTNEDMDKLLNALSKMDELIDKAE